MEAEVTVREIMTREYLGVSEADTVGDAVGLMLEEGAASVVVLRGTDPVGMVTTIDTLELVTSADDPAETAVRSVMSGNVLSVDPDDPVSEAAGAIADTGIGSLLVVDDGELVGVVSERDVVRATATLAEGATLTQQKESAQPGPVSTPVEVEETAAGNPAERDYSTQSVCEICGSLTPDLRNFNGQLICGDCREV